MSRGGAESMQSSELIEKVQGQSSHLMRMADFISGTTGELKDFF